MCALRLSSATIARQRMEIAREHTRTLLDTRDVSFRRGVPASGLFHCRDGKFFAEIVREGECFRGGDFLRRIPGVIAWRTVFGNVKGAELADMLTCSFEQRKVVDAVLLGANEFWRVILTPREGKRYGVAASKLAKMGVVDNCVVQVNTALEGFGRVQRSPYLVFEDPSLTTALDFFRRSGCDVDWVKEQVYGKRLCYVPENFPKDVTAPEEIIAKYDTRKVRQENP